MVLMRMSAFSAMLASAAFIGQHPHPKNAKTEWDKKKAFNPMVPFPESLQTQKRLQPFDADEFDFKALNQTKTAEKADLLFLESHKKTNSKHTKTLKSLKPQQLSGPVCDLIVPIYQKPNPHCALTPDDATLLAKSAILDKVFTYENLSSANNNDKLEDMELLMKKIKTPWDLQTADRAICQVLDKANIKATPEQVRANNEEALFLKYTMGQYVGEGARSGIDTFCMQKARLSMMNNIMNRMKMGVTGVYRSLGEDGKLKQKEARLLAESFILDKPLKNRLGKLEEEVIGFKDMVVLEGEAIQILEEACQNAKCSQAKTQLAMNFLALSDKVGAHHKERIRDTSWATLWYSDSNSKTAPMDWIRNLIER